MSRQRAIVVTEIGKAVELTEFHLIPEPKAHQIQVRVTVAALNGHDQKARDWGLFLEEKPEIPLLKSHPAIGLPAVLANDVVGTITKLGEGVTTFEVGDRVVGQAEFAKGSFQNGLQQYAVLDEGFTAKIPNSISDDDAATLPTNVVAAVVALFHSLPIPAPWTDEAQTFDYANVMLLVIGGGSHSGRFAVQLAKLAGIGKLVVLGGNEDDLKKYGATNVINRHGGDSVVLERIRAVVGDELIYAYDVVNSAAGQVLGVNALSNNQKGTLARLITFPDVDDTKITGKQAGYEIRNTFGVSHAQPELCKEFWKRVPAYLERGLLVAPQGYQVKQGLTAENVNDCLDTFQDGRTIRHAHIHV